MIRSWKDADVVDTSESSRSYSSSVQQQRQVSKGIHSSSNGTPHMTLYNTVIEEKIIIEQIDNSGAKLAEQLRVTIEERYRNVSSSVQDLLQWLKSIEKELGRQEPIRESLEELKQQISSLKFIHDDLWSHGDDVNSTLAQIRQLLSEATTVISTQNLSTLEEYGNQLKTRYDRAENSADQLLRKSTTAYEELSKYTTEKNVFSDWLKTSCHTLVDIEKRIESNTFKQPEKLREFVTDVVSHKAELRFLEMTANRFTDTTQDYLMGLNEIRAKLSQRLPALRKKGSQVQDEFKEISSVYNDLLSRTNKLFDSLDFRTRQKEFEGKVDDAIGWLKKMTPKVQKLIDEPLKTKPKEAEDQLIRAKGLAQEIISNRGLITAVKTAGDNLIRELPPAETAAVLKTCKDIEDRYEHLLTNVNTKLRELESGATLVNKIDDNLKAIHSILEREEKRLPPNAGSTPREVESIAQTLQQILRTLDDNTNLLDTTRSFINELLRKGQGNEGLRSDFVQLQDRWSNLEKTARDRLGFSDTIRKFYELHQSLSNWLDGKEKVLNGLPAADAMAQLQQLKSLRDDFKGQTPKLNELNGVGETLIRRANLTVAERGAIEDTLSALNKRWNDLLNKMDQRKAEAESLLDARGDFDKNCNRLEDALRRINDDLDNLAHEKSKLRPEAVLQQIKALEKALSSQKGPLASLEASGQKLIDTLPDLASKSDIKSKLTGVGRLFDQCSKKLDSLRKGLEASEKQAREFNDACTDMQKWVDSMLAKLDNISISADRNILKDQMTTYEKICGEVLSKKPDIQKLSQKGKEFESAGNAVPALQLLQQSWAALEKEATTTRNRLSKAYDQCLKYDKTYHPFSSWLNSAQDKLESLSLDSLRKSDIERMLREMLDLKKECSRRGVEYTETDSLGQTFLSACDRDKEGVRGELRDLKESWEALLNAIERRLARLNDLNEKLRTFNDHVGSAKKVMDKCDTELDTATTPGKMRAIGEELSQLEKTIDGIKREGDAICRLGAEDGCDTDNIAKAVEDLYDRLSNLQSKLNSRSDSLDAEQKALALCQEKFKEITSNLAALESELDGMKPIGRDVPTVQSQISTMTDFNRRLRDEQEEIDHIARHVEQLSLRGTDTTRLKPQLDEIKKKAAQLNSKAGARTAELDATLRKLQDFYKLYKSTDEELIGLLRKELSLETTQALDEFRRREVAAVGKRVDEVNAVGRILIKTASSGVKTNILESDLEKLNEKWKSLNDRIAEKRRALENQHLKGKQFDEAVAHFLASLKQLESLLIEDGKVHGDLDTVKGLVAHHKKIEDQLGQRRGQLQGIVKSAAELLESAATLEEKSKVSAQVGDAKDAYEKIKSKCDRRSQKLEGALRDAEKLSHDVHSLLEWLAIADKRRKAYPESIQGLDEGNAVKILEEHEKFLRELERKEAEKDATLDFARTILAKAHPNAVAIIKNWISSIETKWADLSNWALKRKGKLQDLLASLRESSELLKELLAWLRKREETLKRVDAKILPNDLDELLILIREHNEFMETVDGKQAEVNFACDLKGSVTKRLTKTSATRAKSPSPGKSNLFPSIGPNFEKSSEPHASGNAMVKVVWHKWKDVWSLSWDRQARLERKYNELMRRFSWEDWKKRFLKFMNYNKDRIKELFTKLDRKNAGVLPRNKFIDAITNTTFPTTDLEMNEVAKMFDNGDDETDYMRFLAALRAEWAEKKVLPEATLINNEIQRQVSKCTCKQRFRVEQVAEGTYRFGESQKLRLVRILRSTVMVRVGGGWVSLEEFLTKNDPCRMKGRTNVELREQLNTPEGAAHIMAAFTAKRRGDRDASKSHSPSPVRQPEKGIWKDRSKY